jgi:translation initiation factor 2 subunit 1
MDAKEEWPEVGDLVVATAKKVVDYGAYVALDEYGEREGLLHISEISTRWVRNIRDHVKEGQKFVLRVLRINKEKGQIDLSLKRVGKSEHKEKMEEFKKDRRARSLLAQCAKVLNISEGALYEKAGIPIAEKYGSLYDGLEEAAKKGVSALMKLGIPNEIIEPLAEISKEKIKIRMFEARGVINATCRDPKGVIIIREALFMAKKLGKKKKADVEIYTVGAPKYRVEVATDDPKRTESSMKEIVAEITSAIEKAGGTVSFTRE